MELLIRHLSWFKLKATFEGKNTIDTSVYTVFEAITKEINNILGIDKEIIFHVIGTPFKYKLKRNRKFDIEIIFPLHTLEEVSYFKQLAIDYFNDPWNSRNMEPVAIHEPELRNYRKLMEEFNPEKIYKSEEICLEFLTPLSFNPEHPKKRQHITKDKFIDLIFARVKRLYNIKLNLRLHTENLTVLPYWHYDQLVLLSFSQPGSQRYINGCVGKLYLKGELREILPYIILCSELHAGSIVSHGRGYFLLHTDKHISYFDSPISVDTLKFYVNKNSDVIKDEPEKLTKQLYEAIISGSYEPSSSNAFILKDSGLKTETLCTYDRIVFSFIYKMLKNPVDNILPLTVVGYRPSISEQDIKKHIQELIEKGYKWSLSFTVDGFYTKLNHEKIIQNLKNLIPIADHNIVKIIEKHLKSGFIYEGKYSPRTEGLPMGSPLSALLANIYLLEVDETLNDPETVALRHADSYLILSSMKEILYEKLEIAKKKIKSLGLNINEKSIKFTHYTEGIKFAGITIESKSKADTLRKPLYITHRGKHISISSETLNISDSRKNTETLPLKRVSEIIIFEDISLTTPFIRKCLKENIPVTISSYFNSPRAIIHPQSKSIYESIFRHTLAYLNLSRDAILFYAREIASLKLKGYEMLFSLKRHLYTGSIKERLKILRQKIVESTTIDTVRGYEAVASKQIYSELNLLIKNPQFQIKSRKRQNPDPINSLLNLCSHLIFNRINTIVCSAGMNPYLGFLHSPDNRYESLVADIQELLRAKIDSFVINLINLKIISIKDFKESDGAWSLKSTSLAKFLNNFEGYLNETYFEETTLNDFISAQVQRIKQWTHGQELYFEIPW